MTQPFKWDYFSDQPYIIKDKSYKKAQRKKHIFSLLKTYLFTLLLPLAYILKIFDGKKEISTNEFFGICVNLDKQPSITPQLLSELGVKSVLLRIALWEIDKIDEYKEFIDSLKEYELFIVIMQDREHIENEQLLKNNLRILFENTSLHVKKYQVATTINRAKWGFFSVNEYLKFFKTAQSVAKEFNDLELFGGGVIDFEYHYSTHTLFNLENMKYDGYSSLLYVDRRGAPENTQMGFNLLGKIDLLSSLVNISTKSKNTLFITETNWPISDTAPYAPTSEYECISEELYSCYMLRYYFLALSSKKINRVYWHQLIASGYGLIDEREGIIKREAFYAYKVMVENLSSCKDFSLHVENNMYVLKSENIKVLWCNAETKKIIADSQYEYFDKLNNKITTKHITLSDSPIYMKEKHEL
jgi:hypothetical protein